MCMCVVGTQRISIPLLSFVSNDLVCKVHNLIAYVVAYIAVAAEFKAHTAPSFFLLIAQRFIINGGGVVGCALIIGQLRAIV